jgi:hypothetical protein
MKNDQELELQVVEQKTEKNRKDLYEELYIKADLILRLLSAKKTV